MAVQNRHEGGSLLFNVSQPDLPHAHPSAFRKKRAERDKESGVNL